MDWFNSGCVVGGPNGAATLDCIGPLFKNVVDWLLAFSGTAAVFFFIFSGIKIITSGGDAKQLDSARRGLAFSIIGLILILLSFAIINIVSMFTGIDCIKRFGFSACLQAKPAATASPGDIRKSREN